MAELKKSYEEVHSGSQSENAYESAEAYQYSKPTTTYPVSILKNDTYAQVSGMRTASEET